MTNPGKAPRNSTAVCATVLLGILLGFGSHRAAAAPVSSNIISVSQAKNTSVPVSGKLVKAFAVSDKAGKHLLLLTTRTGPSRNASRGKDERTDLNASLYIQRTGKWVREWAIQDAVDCPGLDHAAGFFVDQVTVTDLDSNGTAEITVPYKLFCGGGIDPATLKIILRQGDHKFAVRGTTRIEVSGDAPFGGEAVFDESLSRPENAVFKKHLESIRAKVLVQKY